MFIAILDLTTTTADRPAVLEQLRSEKPGVRSMPGNVDFRVYAGDDDTTVTALHEWDSQDAFQAYLESDAFARSGEVIRPLVTAPPVSRRFRAELIETVA